MSFQNLLSILTYDLNVKVKFKVKHSTITDILNYDFF